MGVIGEAKAVHGGLQGFCRVWKDQGDSYGICGKFFGGKQGLFLPPQPSNKPTPTSHTRFTYFYINTYLLNSQHWQRLINLAPRVACRMGGWVGAGCSGKRGRGRGRGGWGAKNSPMPGEQVGKAQLQGCASSWAFPSPRPCRYLY